MASVKGDRAGRQQKPLIKVAASQSSFIAGFEYDEANETLTTHMKDGAIYQHKMISPGDFEELQTSKDLSRHWARAIRGKNPSVRVKSAKAPNSAIKTGRA